MNDSKRDIRVNRSAPRRRHLCASVLAALVALGAVAPSHAQRNDEPQSYGIQAGTLAEALNQLAGQSQLQIIYPPELVRGRTATPLAGRYTWREALQRLLDGSGLSWNLVNDTTVVIQASEAPRPTQAPAPRARPAAASEVPAPVDLGSVMVTARKRDERQIDVPIAISTITGEQIDAMGLRNVVDVINLVPGASAVDTGSSATQVQIRGVSSSLGGNDNGYYLGETPFTGVTVPWYPDTRSFDLDRVEVLKGPQGTLFGEGSMGGTVRIIPRRPEFDRFAAGVELDAYAVRRGADGWGAKAYANVPLVDDRLALRVAATDEHKAGWIDDGVTGEQDINDNRIRTQRAMLRFAATERWNFDLSYWKFTADAESPANSAYDDMTGTAGLTNRTEWDSASLTTTYDFDGAQLVYTFADGDMLLVQGGLLGGGIPIEGSIDIGVRTQELRLASTGERRLDWTVGYYLRDAERADITVAPGILDTRGRQTNSAHAIFGEATLELPNPAWELTAGLRYFADDVDALDVDASDGSISTLDDTFDSWNPRVSLAYKPSEDTTFYISAARGFRSGQLQPISSVKIAESLGIVLPPGIDPDSIWTYELGVKSVLSEGRLMLEGAVFHSDWKGVAVRVPLLEGPINLNGLINSEGTTNRGVELNLVYTPVQGLTLQFGGSYVDATYSADVPGTTLTKGTPVTHVPKTSLNASAAYAWDVGPNLRGVLNGGIHHDSARETPLTVGTPGDPITLAYLRVGLESPSGWGIHLYGSNLTDEDGAVRARGRTEFDADGNFLRLGAAARSQPRTFGVLFRYDY